MSQLNEQGLVTLGVSSHVSPCQSLEDDEVCQLGCLCGTASDKQDLLDCAVLCLLSKVIFVHDDHSHFPQLWEAISAH